eukprot:TRINITY_DN4474_c0_g1_i1.p1 TRINITY_DN4474_c0_g1~~TRINITY_DN4474_c0_g1_i1.p1  ORF type:complete len:799 (+),score=209.70 TRINITY_DN4474_c0_g1_i1:370-2766(+)
MASADELSHSWLWDNHQRQKNSKWLEETLETMDANFKTILNLIEEDSDSSAPKAETYYKKRPELVNQVEGFYRQYRSLAERHDHLSAELKKKKNHSMKNGNSSASTLSSNSESEDEGKENRRNEFDEEEKYLDLIQKEIEMEESMKHLLEENETLKKTMEGHCQQKEKEIEESRKHLLEENESLRKKMECQNHQIAYLQDQISFLQVKNNEVESEIKSGIVDIKENATDKNVAAYLSEESPDMRSQLRKLEEQNESLTMKLARCQEDYHASLCRISEMECTSMIQKDQVYNTEEEFYSLKQNKLDMQKHFDILLQQNEASHRKFLEGQSEITELVKENANLQKLIHDGHMVKELQSESSPLIQEKHDSNYVDTEELQKEGDEPVAKSLYENLKADIESSNARLDTLRQQVEDFRQRNKDLQGKNAELEKCLSTYEQEKQSLRDDLRDTRIQREELQGRLVIVTRILNERIGTLEKLYSSSESERERLLKEKTKFQEQSNSLQGQVSELEGLVTFWRQKAEMIANDFDLLYEEKLKVESICQEQAKELAQLQLEAESLQDENRNMSLDHQKLQDELETLKDSLKSLKQANDFLNEENIKLRTEKQSFAEETSSKKERIKELQVEKFTLKLKSQRLIDGLTKIQEKVLQLQSQLASLEDENVLKQSSEETIGEAQKLKEDLATLERDKSSFVSDVFQQLDEVNKLNDKISRMLTEKNDLMVKLALQSEHNKKLEAELEKLEIREAKYNSDEDSCEKVIKENQMQKMLILEREEEKREAIRQLSFAVDYYRSLLHRRSVKK